MTARKTLLFTALVAALFAASPAFAQVAPPPETTETDAGVPKDRLVDEYADTLFAGDEVAAGDAVTALRTGGDFSITQQKTNPDGTPMVDANGQPVMETRPVANANGPMGWGEVDHSLGLAQALVDKGDAGSFDEALLGEAITETTTVTNADGTTTTTTTTTYSGGILEMRADGMGWGQIAKELGFKSMGEVKSGRYADAETEAETEATATVASDTSAKGKDTAKAAREKTHGKSAEHKPDRAAKAERVTGKPEKVERIAKVDRPERFDRPERPSKPERGGRP